MNTKQESKVDELIVALLLLVYWCAVIAGYAVVISCSLQLENAVQSALSIGLWSIAACASFAGHKWITGPNRK